MNRRQLALEIEQAMETRRPVHFTMTGHIRHTGWSTLTKQCVEIPDLMYSVTTMRPKGKPWTSEKAWFIRCMPGEFDSIKQLVEALWTRHDEGEAA